MALKQFNNSVNIYYFDPSDVETTHFQHINSQDVLMIGFPSGTEYGFYFDNRAEAIAWINANLPISGEAAHHNCECP